LSYLTSWHNDRGEYCEILPATQLTSTRVIEDPRPNYRNACSIAALQAITGRPWRECRELLIEVRGTHRKVTGIAQNILMLAIESYGLLTYNHPSPSTLPTLAQWLRARDNQYATYLVVLRTHYVVVKGRKVWDNGTLASRDGTWIRSMKGRRRRVQSVVEVTYPMTRRVEVCRYHWSKLVGIAS